LWEGNREGRKEKSWDAPALNGMSKAKKEGEQETRTSVL
jgi:hypothetical protein